MSGRIWWGIDIGLLLAAGTLLAQAPAVAPAFEVASIKPAAPLDPSRILSGKIRIGVKIDAARVDIGNLSLAELVSEAYRVKPYQVSGPDWIRTQRFDVLAKLPEGASKDQVPEMLQALLAERFKLTFHRETKEQPVYALVVGKNGSKLKETPPDADAPIADGAAPGAPEAGPQVRASRDGKGMTVTGGPMGATRFSMGQDGTMHLETAKTSMAMFTEMLARFVDRPVVDMTELKGNYQVALDLSMEDMRNVARASGLMFGGGAGASLAGGDAGRAPAVADASDPAQSSVFASVQQLGLKLDPRKTPTSVLVIDHAERMPTEN